MVNYSELSDSVYDALKEMIVKNELKPGQKLLQEKLAAQLGVSRTPLLKALQMLEFDFMVESLPRRGMFVKKLSAKEMQDYYDVREGMEIMAIRLATQRITGNQLRQLKKIWEPFKNQNPINFIKYRDADDKFHAMLLEISDNPILKKIYNHSFIQARIIQMGLMRPPEVTLPEHISMVEAIENGDADRAEKELREHLQKSKALIDEKFKNEIQPE
jgi:DNA-binding GntR family transcriptional regulator